MADHLAAPGITGAPAPDAPAAAARTPAVLARYALGIVVGVVVLWLLFGRRSELAAAVRQLGTASPQWIMAAIGAEALSMLGYAVLQWHVLRLADAGSAVPLPGLFLLTLGNAAINCTVPGEPAVSSGYRYRYYRRRGASSAAGGWTVFTILIAQAIGMSLVLLIGVLVALAAAAGHKGASPASLGVIVVGLLVVVGAGAVLVRRDLVLGLGTAATRRLARWRRQPPGGRPGGLLTRIEATLARMRDIPLGRGATVGVVAIATAVWLTDFGCLLCGFRAVHAAIPWHGVLLAYGASVVVGSLPLVPGGLGIVEGSLAVVLVGYGASRLPAVSAVLMFRMVNYWLAIAVGWVSVGLVALRLRRIPAARRAAGADADG